MTSPSCPLYRDSHHSFLVSLVSFHSGSGSSGSSSPPSYESVMSEHLRMNGLYWSLMSSLLLSSSHVVDGDSMCSLMGTSKTSLVSFVMACFNKDKGGFSGNIGHDVHILYTLSALQILTILGEMSRIDCDGVGRYIGSLQQSDGSFIGDEWGEVDTRFTYCAVQALALVNRLCSPYINIDSAVSYIDSCRNFDGGYGAVPGAESHGGQIFCCIGTLAILKKIDSSTVNKDLLGAWLCERQLTGGGLNGRPEKKEDVCYSWWILSSLAIIDRLDWISAPRLIEFILSSQDPLRGGISDRPGNQTDIFHLFFGLAGLSLLDYRCPVSSSDAVTPPSPLLSIDPVYALPRFIVKKYNLPTTFNY